MGWVSESRHSWRIGAINRRFVNLGERRCGDEKFGLDTAAGSSKICRAWRRVGVPSPEGATERSLAASAPGPHRVAPPRTASLTTRLLFSFPVFPARKGRQGPWRRCPLRRTQRRYRLPGVAPCGASIQSTGEKVDYRAGNLGLTRPGYALPPHSRLPRAGVLARHSAANWAQQNLPVPGNRGRAGKANFSSREGEAPSEPRREQARRELCVPQSCRTI
jgi:hypothetical protein